jgi:hypothetical protein
VSLKSYNIYEWINGSLGLFVELLMGIMEHLDGFILVISKNILIIHRLLFLEHNVHLTLKKTQEEESSNHHSNIHRSAGGSTIHTCKTPQHFILMSANVQKHHIFRQYFG